MMLKAIYYVLNLRLIIILIETILVLQLYKTYDIKIEIDLTVLSVAIVFPYNLKNCTNNPIFKNFLNFILQSYCIDLIVIQKSTNLNYGNCSF